jgi:uncharacterized repeat protein (TIGR01451 family)
VGRTSPTHALLWALILAFAGASFTAPALKAATIDVDVDPVTGAGVVAIASDGLCSLREAIINANDNAQTHADCAAGSGSRNEVFLPEGSVFTLTNAAVSDTFGNTGLPYITRPMIFGSVGDGATIQRADAGCNSNGSQTANEFRLLLVRGVDLLITDVTLALGCADGTGNQRNGGAIYIDQGELTLFESTLRNNQAHSGAGIYSAGSMGVAIFGSTLSGNTATLGAGLNVDGQTDLINSTLSDNSTFSLGAGAFVRAGATLNLDFVTIDGSASAQPSDIHASDATVNIKNSILRNSRCTQDTAAPSSSWNASGFNLDSGSGCANRFGSNFQAQATLNLGPLADNGGPTQTRAVLAGSQAIDAALDCTLQQGLILGSGSPVGSDQRDEARPQSFACDIGAYESALTLPGQTIHVDEVDGEGVVAIQADGLCSLREALDNANGNVPGHADCEAGGGIDTVVLPAGALFTLDDAHVSDATGSTGLPHIVSKMNIQGNGATIERSNATACVINGVNDPGEFRLLYVNNTPSGLTIEDLTLVNGCADGADAAGNGGAISSTGELVLRRSSIRDSRANQGGGITAGGTTLIDTSTLSGNSAALGGGLLIGGASTVRNSTLSGNSASSEGGAAWVVGSPLTLEQSTLASNTAPSGGGVKVSFLGSLNARNTIFHDSSCAYLVTVAPPGTFSASGNNVENGESCALLFLSNFTANAATNLGALAHNGGTMQTHALLPGSQAINTAANCTDAAGGPIGTDQRGVPRPQSGVCDIGAYELHTQSAGPATIFVDEVSAGTGAIRVVGDGLCSLREAMENANANSATFLHPDCEPGFTSGLDQIILPAGAVFTLTDPAIGAPFGNTGLPAITSLTALRGNGATIESGNACNFDGSLARSEFRLFLLRSGALGLDDLTLANGCADGAGSARDGGAVYVEGGVLIARNTTVRDSRARRGGAIFNLGSTLVQTGTLSGNSATFGGAMFNGATATLSNATVSGNTTASLGGAAFIDPGGVLNIEQSTFNGTGAPASNGIYSSLATVNLKNTILNNTRCDENIDAAPSTWNATGDNLDNQSICASLFGSNFTPNATIRLAPLADNGGNTQTHALLPGSPAIDAVSSCTEISLFNITNDQRDIARPQGTACDIGAFESRGFALAIGGGDNQSVAPGTPFANPLSVTVTPNAGGEPVDGGVVIFTAPAAGASASLATNPAMISGGNASTTATANATSGNYQVGANTTGSSAAVFFTLANLQTTTTTITAPVSDPSVVGQPYLVTVNVEAVSSSPTGTVTISDGVASCGPVTLVPTVSPNSTASCTLTSFSAGSKLLTASYVGTDFVPSVSAGVVHQVNPAATSISVSGPPRSRINTPTPFDFALTVNAPGGGTPTGTVSLSSGSSSCQLSLPSASNSCELSFDLLGPRTISASFTSSDGNHLASSSSGGGDAQTLVYALSDLVVSKTDTVDSYAEGDLLVYTITLRNLGPDPAENLRLRDQVPAGLVDVQWSCDSSGGASCPASSGSGDIDAQVPSYPVGALLNYSFYGNVAGQPEQILNTATVELPADETIEDANPANNSASDLNLRNLLFGDGFEAATVNAASGSFALPSAALHAVLDETARVVYLLDDAEGQAARVYARVFDGQLQYALAQRASGGLLRLGPWVSYADEPQLRWSASEQARGWVVQSVSLE